MIQRPWRRTVELIALTMLLSVTTTIEAQDSTHAGVNEVSLRKAALTRLIPPLPASFNQDCKQGVAVATVWVDPSGNVSDVRIETSPSKAIGESMLDAIRRWRFMSGQDMNESTGYMGKITYYFLEQNKHPQVLDPYIQNFYWNGEETWCKAPHN